MNVSEIVSHIQQKIDRDDIPEINPDYILRRRIDDFENWNQDYEPLQNSSSKSENISIDTLFQELQTKYDDTKKPTLPTGIGYGIENDGIDAYAWYHPFHYQKGDPGWGIYLHEQGLWKMASNLEFLRESGHTTNDLVIIAGCILFWHEYFHFLNEIAASTIEISKKKYTTYFRLQEIQRKRSPIKTMSVGNDLDCLNYYELEEALANSFCLKKSTRIQKGIASKLKSLMDTMPRGYQHYGEFSQRSKFEAGCSFLAGEMANDNRIRNPTDQLSPYQSLYHTDLKHVKIQDVPIYLIHDISNPNLRIRKFEHKPPREWRQHSNFEKEFKKLEKKSNLGKGKLREIFNQALQYASSESAGDRQRVENSKVYANDHLWHFRVTHSLRAFYKICNQEIVLVGIRNHPNTQGGSMTRLYNGNYC